MKRNFLWLLARLILLFQLTACSTITTSNQADPVTAIAPPVTGSAQGWHYARFRIPYTKSSPPNWSMGTLIAVEIIQPVLNKHRDSIPLWRFHRRAGHDAAGHQFSFVFYSNKTTASQLYREIQSSPLLQQLTQRRKVMLLTPDDLSKNPRPNIEDSSDKSWSTVIQKTWPHYIMGISQQWLKMVTAISNDQEKTVPLEARYQEVQNIANHIWQREGKHAFLHHLNAIHAYQPLLIRY